MVSWGELILTLTAASYVIGRKELPKIGNIAGMYTGRAVGAIIRAKKEFFDATKDSKVVQVADAVTISSLMYDDLNFNINVDAARIAKGYRRTE